MNCPIPIAKTARRQAFSLPELMIAVGLLTVVVLALYMVFNQTQKAFRASLNQVDVSEAARAVLDLMRRDLERAAAAGLASDSEDMPPNLTIRRSVLAPLLPEQRGASVGPLASSFHELYFLTRHADQANRFEPQGYFIGTETNAGFRPTVAVGTLYRFTRFVSDSNLNAITNRNSANRYAGWLPYRAFFLNPLGESGFRADRTNAARVVDGVVLFRILGVDGTGRAYNPYDNWFHTNNWTCPGQANAMYRHQYLRDLGIDLGIRGGGTGPTVDDRSVVFGRASIPEALDLELGVLEPGTLETYRSIANPKVAQDFLFRNKGKIQIFRQRIELRTAPQIPSDPCRS